MPHHKSTKKRLITDARKRLQNRSARSRCRTLERRFREAAASGDKDSALASFRTVQKALDQAAGHNIYKKETVARKKSRLTKVLNDLNAA
jgi:small subunit ribosomal protein S20